MVPVLGIPYINRPDLFERTLRSISHPVGQIVVIDNSIGPDRCPEIPSDYPIRYIHMYQNMGVSWAWNTIIMNTFQAPYWVISNADVRLGDDLRNVEERMEQGVDLCLVEGMAVFGISADCVQRVGWFDLNFIPAYCEDNDYVWRAQRVGVKIDNIHADFKHYGSATIKSDERLQNFNNRSYPENVALYREKWGGDMGAERYETPFDRGGDPRETAPLDLERLRALSWE